MFGPSKMPVAIVNRLSQEVTRVISQAEAKKTFLNVGSEIVPGSPEELAALMKSEMTTFAKLFKDAGIKVE